MTEQDDIRLQLDQVNSTLASGPPPLNEHPQLPGYGGGIALPFSAAGGIHLKDYIKILHKRRVLVLTTALTVIAASLVYLFTAVPIYEARAKILIEAEGPNIVSFKEVVDPESNRSDYYQTQYDLLKSRSLSRRTIDNLKLWKQPPFASTGSSAFSLRALPGKALRAVRDFFSAPAAPSEAADETAAQSRAIDAFLGGLTVSPVRNSRVVDLIYRSQDPATAMRIVNAQAQGYIEQTLEFRFLSSKDATGWLGDRLSEQGAQVSAAEAKLQQYRERNDTIGLNAGENIVLQKLSDLTREVTRATTERLSKQAIYDQLKGIQGNSALLDTFPAVLTNSFIQQQKSELQGLLRTEEDLAQRFGDNYPQLINVRNQIKTSRAKLAADIGKVVQGVENDYKAAVAAEQSLTQAFESQKREAMASNRTAIEYSVLEREVEMARSVYQTLSQRAKETGVSSELRTSNVRVVDLAEFPRSPVSPRVQLILSAGFAGGLLLAVVLGFFFEYLDNRFKTPDELKIHLGISPLGMLPLAKTTEGVYPLIINPDQMNLAEAFRTLRTNVIFSSAEQGARTVAITSTSPGEGKTVVASNLAISLAEAGFRVLLIDADMRKPKVHRVFEVEKEPGLSNLMVGTARASEAVRKTKLPSVWVLPAGRTPPNPSELLGSNRFKDFLSSLRAHFDWIVIDTPPVLAVADASVVGHVVNDVIFVVAAEMVSRHAASTALEQLANARAHVIGGILNRVDLERNQYYYSQYYRKEYTDYYVKPSA